MSSTSQAQRYHIPVALIDLTGKSDEQLEEWASDPNCIEQKEVAEYLSKRKALQAAQSTDLQAQRDLNRKELQENPFNPRTEVSADAKYITNKIVIHLWVLLVALPVVLAILYSILR